MNAYSLPPLLAAAVNVSLIFMILSVYADYRKRSEVLPYILWNLSMALWNIGFFALYSVQDIQLAFRFNHLLILGTMFIFPTTFHFILDFTGQKTPVNRILLYLAYSLSLVFLYLHFNGNSVSAQLAKYSWGYYPLAGDGDLVYSAVFFWYATYSQVLLYRLMKHSTGQKRDRCRYVFLGTFIGYAGGVTNFLPPFGINVYPVGNLTTVFYTMAVAYALVTVKMINLHYLFRRAVAEAFAMAALVLISLVAVYPLMLLVPGRGEGAIVALVMLTALIVARLFHAKMSDLFVSRVFSRNARFLHDIREKAALMRNILTKKKLVEEMLQAVAASFRVQKCLVRIIEKDTVLSGRGEYGEDRTVSQGIASFDCRGSRDTLFSFLAGKRDLLMRDEMAKKIELGQYMHEDELRLCAEMSKNKIAVLVPLGKNDTIRGYILLGDKLSNDIFDTEEVYALRLIKDAAELALANIENVEIIKAQEKKLEEELQKASRLESLGILAGGIAHDFNNLLTAVMGNISIARRAAPGEGVLPEVIGEAEKALSKAIGLTYQLLTFSKGGAPVKKNLSIAQLLRDCTVFVLRGSNVRCEFLLPENLWTVQLDEGQFSQVINNIVINAQQAMPGGGVIELSAQNAALDGESGAPRRAGRFVKVSIRDHGCGIPRENLDRIFDPYFTTKEKGNGLGLASAYSIMRRHGGFIDVESEPGQGTVFHLHVPVASGPAKKPERPRPPALSHEGKGRILVMDDDVPIQKLLQRMLRSFGYDVALCGSGEEAVSIVTEARGAGKPFDGVIMDLTIPGGMGGKEAVGLVKQACPGIKAIASSGYTDDDILADPAGHGFDGIISKPYTYEDMSAVFENLFGKSRGSC